MCQNGQDVALHNATNIINSQMGMKIIMYNTEKCFTQVSDFTGFTVHCISKEDNWWNKTEFEEHNSNTFITKSFLRFKITTLKKW